MRVYKFLDCGSGLKSLREKRLKLSVLEDLNDPFELLPFVLSKRDHRAAMRRTLRELAASRGMLCFSADWRDPVIWAHYSSKHRGLCLGFDIPGKIGKKVRYVSRRLPFPASPRLTDADAMLFTKFDNWAYEKEVRVWAALNDKEGELYYAEFGDALKLVKVVAGARSTISRQEIDDALGPLSDRVSVIKARAAFTKFKIVKDKLGFKIQ